MVLMWIMLIVGIAITYFAKNMKEVTMIAGAVSFLNLIVGTITGWATTAFQAPIVVAFFFSFIFSIVVLIGIMLGGFVMLKLKKR